MQQLSKDETYSTEIKCLTLNFVDSNKSQLKLG